LPVEAVLTLSQSASLRLTASSERPAERRLDRQAHEESRHRARAFEFASIIVVSACLGAMAFTMVEQALARPVVLLQVALGG
jgi:hypothetical protein